jgi:protein SCO1/2
MKKIGKKNTGLLIIIILFGIYSIPKIIDRLSNESIIDTNRLHQNDELSFLKIEGEDRRVPDFVLINQDSLFISNDDLLGKVYVLEFFFSRCPDICIEMNKNMKKLDDKFGDLDNFGIVSITIDPAHDTPIILKKYSENLEVKSKDWHFLTGDRNYIYDLANKGFNIYANENPNFAGGFEHQGYFALIDKQGYIRSRNDDYGNPILYYLGIDDQSIDLQGIDMLENDIQKLINE